MGHTLGDGDEDAATLDRPPPQSTIAVAGILAALDATAAWLELHPERTMEAADRLLGLLGQGVMGLAAIRARFMVYRARHPESWEPLCIVLIAQGTPGRNLRGEAGCLGAQLVFF